MIISSYNYACYLQLNLVNMNTVKVKHLLNANHFEIPRHLCCQLHYQTLKVRYTHYSSKKKQSIWFKSAVHVYSEFCALN